MSDESNYWRQRLNRRILLGGSLAATAGVLVACGGKSGGNAGQSAQSGAGTGPSVTTKQPKPGGSVSMQLSSAPPSLDPYTQTSFINAYVNSLSYSKLYRFRNGVPEYSPTDFTMEPDLAQKMPEQPDQLSYVIKLKTAKFHNGRAVTSEDIRYAIDRYLHLDKSVHQSTWGFLDKIETPDPATVVLKTKSPYADTVQIAGGNLGAWISPKEHAESAEAATKMLGSGPFIHKEFQTGVSLTFAKNSDYYDKPFPYFDEVKAFITTDEPKRVADFSGKSVDLTWLFLPEERDQLKKNRPDAKYEETPGIGSYIYMRTDKPPFNDKRVRQALSMAINRKAIRDALTKGEGENDQFVFVGFTDWARKTKDLGPGAKFFDYNLADAKALLKAAGIDKLDFTWSHADAAVYGQAYVDFASLVRAQWKELGVNVTDNQQPYAQYISTTYQGNYDGAGHSPRSIPYWIDTVYENAYMDSAGKRARINLSYINDAQLNQLLDKQRTQFDVAERKKTIREIETIVAEQQYYIFGSTDSRTFFWGPDIQNYRPIAFYPRTHLMKIWRDKA